MVEQAEILEHDADAAPELGAGAWAKLGDVLAEHDR